MDFGFDCRLSFVSGIDWCHPGSLHQFKHLVSIAKVKHLQTDKRYQGMDTQSKFLSVQPTIPATKPLGCSQSVGGEWVLQYQTSESLHPTSDAKESKTASSPCITMIDTEGRSFTMTPAKVDSYPFHDPNGIDVTREKIIQSIERATGQSFRTPLRPELVEARAICLARVAEALAEDPVLRAIRLQREKEARQADFEAFEKQVAAEDKLREAVCAQEKARSDKRSDRRASKPRGGLKASRSQRNGVKQAAQGVAMGMPNSVPACFLAFSMSTLAPPLLV
jgi:hypothetical protein